MMQITAKKFNGVEYELNNIIKYKFYSAEDIPADMLECEFILHDNYFEFGNIEVTVDRNLFFKGIIDEQIMKKVNNYFHVKLIARDITAILLDNQAKPMSYKDINIGQLFNNHAKCYGFKDILANSIPVLKNFIVAKGVSEWHVIELFCKKALGVLPKVKPDGTIDARKCSESKLVRFANNGNGLLYSKLESRYKRHGCISHVFTKSVGCKYNICAQDIKALNKNIIAKRYIEIPLEYSDKPKLYAQEYINKHKNQSFIVYLTSPFILNISVGDKLEINEKFADFTALTVHMIQQEINNGITETKVWAKKIVYKRKGINFMWVAKQLSRDYEIKCGYWANVLSCSNGMIEIEHALTQSNIPIVNSMGLNYAPIQGERVLILPTHSGDVCIGFDNQTNQEINPGEIVIANQSGAFIKLKNNGQIQINSHIF